ncbi:hypothetical protein BC826DRAFT_918932, partial [Russula brevipes]
IVDILPSKSMPTTGRGSRKRKRNKPTVEDVEDEDAPDSLRAQSLVATGSSTTIENSDLCQKPNVSTQNPIYYFYQSVERNVKGSVGNLGDKHYRCHHGNRKVLTITKAMKSSLNGLVGNLKSCSPSMFQFYSILKSRHPEGRITQEEIDIASHKRPLTAEASAEFIGGLEAQAANIKSAFAKQQEQAMVC